MEIAQKIKKSLYHILGFMILLCIGLPTNANTGHFTMQAQAGIGFGHQAHPSDLRVTHTKQDKLKVKDQPTVFEGALGIGYIWDLACKDECEPLRWFPNVKLGLNVYGFEGDIKGDVWEYGTEILDNYDYTTHITSYRLMLDAGLTLLEWKRWSWFVLAGVGESWNRLGFREEVSVNDIPANSGLTLDDHWDTTFAWEVGTGVSWTITPRLDLNLTYLYTDLGKLKLGNDGRVPDADPADVALKGSEFDFSLQSILLGFEWTL